MPYDEPTLLNTIQHEPDEISADLIGGARQVGGQAMRAIWYPGTRPDEIQPYDDEPTP